MLQLAMEICDINEESSFVPDVMRTNIYLDQKCLL